MTVATNHPSLLLFLVLPSVAVQHTMTSSTTHIPPTFLIVCSDDVELQVDTSLLSRNSAVFRDMFQLEAQDRECKVEETSTEFNLMTDALSSAPSGLSLNQIRVLVKLGDKYDSLMLNVVARMNLVYVSCLVPESTQSFDRIMPI